MRQWKIIVPGAIALLVVCWLGFEIIAAVVDTHHTENPTPIHAPPVVEEQADGIKAQRVESLAKEEQKVLVSSQPPAKPKIEYVASEGKPSNDTHLTQNQKDAERLVLAGKSPEYKITIEGKEYSVPRGEGTQEIRPEDSSSWYEVGPNGVSTLSVQRQTLLRQIAEILVTVDKSEIYPGALFHGEHFFEKGQTVGIDLREEDRAPVELTILGVAADSETHAKDIKDKLVPSAPILNRPGNRGSYESLRKQLAGSARLAANWRAQLDFASSTSHLNFQLSGGASGYGFQVGGNFRTEDELDKQAVFFMLRRAAYKIAVDGPKICARWFSPGVDVKALADRFPKNGPVLYCSDLTYGQVILVLAQTTKSAKSLKAALNASYTGLVSAHAEFSQDQKEAVNNATFDVLVYGGEPLYGEKLEATKTVKGDGGLELIEKVSKTPLDAKNALPTGFTLRYLADNREAGFVGVHPHRITQTKPGDGFGYELILDGLDIRQDFCRRFGPFGSREGDFGFMAGHKDGPWLALHRGLDTDYHAIRHAEQLSVRQLEKRGNSFGFVLDARLCENADGHELEWNALRTWRNVTQSPSTFIDVEQLLQTGEKKLHLDFAHGRGTNYADLTIRARPPGYPKYTGGLGPPEIKLGVK